MLIFSSRDNGSLWSGYYQPLSLIGWDAEYKCFILDCEIQKTELHLTLCKITIDQPHKFYFLNIKIKYVKYKTIKQIQNIKKTITEYK